MEKRNIANYGTYIKVWLGLLAFTALTVTAAGINIGGFNIIVPLSIAAVKTYLVLSFFMQLKYEGLSLKIMLSGTVMILAIIIGLTFLDVSFR